MVCVSLLFWAKGEALCGVMSYGNMLEGTVLLSLETSYIQQDTFIGPNLCIMGETDATAFVNAVLSSRFQSTEQNRDLNLANTVLILLVSPV